MIDLFALGVSHGLIALAAWRLLWRDDLDRDPLLDPAPASAAPSATRPAASEPRDA